jgi:hypothetical protein
VIYGKNPMSKKIQLQSPRPIAALRTPFPHRVDMRGAKRRL